MSAEELGLLLGAGLVAGFVAGLAGVGGGVVFAPVLFVLFERAGIGPLVIAPLTIGTSLFCTLVTSTAAAWWHNRRLTLRWRLAAGIGLTSSGAILVVTQLVTTRAWYDGTVFQAVFGLLLIVLVIRIVAESPDVQTSSRAADRPLAAVLAIGTATGAVSAAAGVGGGVVIVPALNRLLGVSMREAIASSSAAIVVIATVGVAVYALSGVGSLGLPGGTTGFVDFSTGLLLAAPATITSRLGASVAHRLNPRALKLGFAAIAAVVAARLLLRAAGL